ncbi:MAG: 3-deoxy-manno-octulosonate cytidylyltransferase [Alphaproteobacteria bacterium]|nr:3-deoxy-manno-octulosonate cytidylyltransferase [Alphaproteobacteria bacterium]
MSTLIVIPARYGSTRLPGKPLAVIEGRTLLERVVDVAARAAKLTGAAYVVATDDERIVRHAGEIGAPAVMTDADLRTGTDRALAAHTACGSTADFILNLQGDAPFTEADHLARLIECSNTLEADVITPVIRLDWQALDDIRERKLKTPFSGTTCVRGADGRAFWFSKNIMPAVRNEAELRKQSGMSPVFRHIGLYAYRLSSLKRFTQLPAGTYETLEGLEQLRFIENGMIVHTVEVERPRISMSGIDSKEDADLAAQLIRKHGDPFHGR